MRDPLEQPIRIFIVDDHPVVVAGLTSMLGTQPRMVVAGCASGGEEAVEMLRSRAVDLLLLDLRMPGMNGIDTLHALARAKMQVRTIILTSYETDEDIYRAVQAGAQGYLLKGAPQSDMVEAIWTVHAGRRYFPRHIAERLAERMMRTELTARELEVLRMLARGSPTRRSAQPSRSAATPCATTSTASSRSWKSPTGPKPRPLPSIAASSKHTTSRRTLSGPESARRGGRIVRSAAGSVGPVFRSTPVIDHLNHA